MSTINNNGRFQKGRKKTGGRKKGTPNKLTVKLHNLFLNFTINRVSSKKQQENFDELLPKDQWYLLCKLFYRLIPSNFDINAENEKNRASSEKEIIDRLVKLAGGFNGINE